jgi:hypothetical protein
MMISMSRIIRPRRRGGGGGGVKQPYLLPLKEGDRQC